MKYEIIGNLVPAVEITLDRGKSVYTQSGGMVWQEEGFEMETNTKGGILKGLGRMFGGDSFFMNTYTSTRDGAKISFASTVPGKLLPITLTQGHPGIIAQKGAFLCAEPSVEFEVALSKRFGAGLFGGEGFILQDIHGEGTAFLEVDGDLMEKNLQAGETLLIDTGNVVCFDKTCSYEITTVKGVKNILFGGEGLFLTKIVGPGRVVLQTQNFHEFAGRIIALMPPRNN